MYCEKHVREYFYSFRDNNRSWLNNVVRMKGAEAAERRYSRTARAVRGMLTLVNFLASLVRSESKFMQLFWSDDPSVLKRRLPDHIKLALKGDEFYVDPARMSSLHTSRS